MQLFEKFNFVFLTKMCHFAKVCERVVKYFVEKLFTACLNLRIFANKLVENNSRGLKENLPRTYYKCYRKIAFLIKKSVKYFFCEKVFELISMQMRRIAS
jgi:hypothetical protein